MGEYADMAMIDAYDFDVHGGEHYYSNNNKRRTIMNKEFYIAGVQHHNSNDVLDELKMGGELYLDPEPTNAYDSNAIRIEFRTHVKNLESNMRDVKIVMLGYVPAKFCAEIGAALTLDPSLPCTITELNVDAKPWERIMVLIGEKPKDDFEDEDNLRNEEY